MEGEVLKTIVRGLVKPLILWFLLKRTMHGYEILNQLTEMTGQKFSPGTIYPILYQLEEIGLIAGKWEQKGERRRIKLYKITEKGLNTLKQFRDVFAKCFNLFSKDIVDLPQNIYKKVVKRKTKSEM